MKIAVEINALDYPDTVWFNFWDSKNGKDVCRKVVGNLFYDEELDEYQTFAKVLSEIMHSVETRDDMPLKLVEDPDN